MESILIGIHGLRNKPPKYILAQWWKEAMLEGFRNIGLPEADFDFRMAYWAQHIHVTPLDPQVKNPEDPHYLTEPYTPGIYLGPREPESFKRRVSQEIHQQVLQLVAVKSGFMNIDLVSDIILQRMFLELDIYYHKKLKDKDGKMRPARELIRAELADLLDRHRDKNIMIVAHSMGTIIAYDVLMHVVPDIPVHTLVTFGSPLAFPVVINKIKLELGREKDDPRPLPTPEAIRKRWLNFSDLDDVTCLDYNLRHHYKENAHHVRPFDEIVYNNYEYQGIKNPHKSYGYLRTADFSRALYNFLVLENAGLWQRIKWVFKKPQY
jgi:hypothetical protein